MTRKDNKHLQMLADPDELVTFAQAYYATEFPNADRSGCPPSAEMRAIALSGELPQGELRAHLLACSECFRLFRSARLSLSPQMFARATPSWRQRMRGAWRGFTASRLLTPVGALALALLMIGGVWWWWQSASDETSPLVAMNRSPQTITTQPDRQEAGANESPANESNTETTTPLNETTRSVRAPRSSDAPRDAALPRIVEINLREDSLMRQADGDDDGERRALSLLPERQRLRLRLPEGRQPGNYTVSVLDAFGRTLVSTAARSNGRTLTTGTIDLRELTPRAYRLSIAREGEVPDYVSFVINSRAHRLMP